MSDIIAGLQPWYNSLNRSQLNTLIAANLGWLFDGYETYALVISVGVALRQLLDPSQYSQIPVYAGTVIAFTLLGVLSKEAYDQRDYESWEKWASAAAAAPPPALIPKKK